MNKCFNNFAGKKFCVVTIFSTETVRTAVIAQNMTSYSRKMVMYNNWDQLTWQRQGRTAMIELKANSCSVQQTAIVFQIFCANFLCKSSLIYSRVLVLRKRSTTHYVLVCIGGQLLEREHIFTRSQEILTVRVSLWEMWQSGAFGWSLVVANVRDGISRAFPNPPSAFTSTLSQRKFRYDICFKKDLHNR